MVVYFDQDKEERWSGTSSPAAQAAFTSWVNQTYMRGSGADLAQVAAQYKGTATTAPPTTTRPPTTTPPTTGRHHRSRRPRTAPPAGACTATYATVGSWQGGFQGEVTVRAGTSGINGWTTRWTLASGQTISQLWSGTLSRQRFIGDGEEPELERFIERERFDDVRVPRQRNTINADTYLHQPMIP